ncbi:MAG: lysostaphin resistance A-like protein, partial [Chitinophagaceae bacterium]
ASIGVWIAMTGKGFFVMEKEMLNPANVQAVRMVQLVSTFFIFFLPAYFTALILNKKPLKFLGFNMYFSGRQLLLAIGIMLVSLPLVGSLSELNKMIPIPASFEKFFKELEETYEKQVVVLSRITGFGDYIIALLVMALGPAIFEETFFRGGMQNILQKWTRNPLMAIIITSIVFSAIHFSYYGFIPRAALGFVLGLLFYYSGSLWLSIAGHFFNNALVVTQIYYYTRQGKSVEEAMNETYPLWIGAIALVVLTGLIYIYKKFSESDKKERTPPEDRALEEKWMA